jgi:RNA polymerase sigma-70 factor (ECF subfamily)
MAGAEDRPEVQVPGQFEVFYREEYGPVVALTYALSRSRPVAEDLAQEAFVRAYRDWHRVGLRAVPGAWVRRVAINLAIGRFRRFRSEVAARARLTVPVSMEPAGVEFEAFWGEVRNLPKRQAQVVALHYVEDLPVAEIAVMLGIAEGTVKALLHQARQRLERQLVAKGWIDQ